MPSSYHVYMAAASTQPGGSSLGHVSIMVDSDANRSGVTVEASASEEFKAIFDSATGQVLVINNRADEFDIENCQVSNASADSYSVMAKISFQGSERIIPSGKFFIGTGLNVVRTVGEDINGVPTTKYRTCHFSTSVQATLEVTWWYPSGSQSPMQVKTVVSPQGSGSAKTETVYTLGPVRQLSGKHQATRHPLAAPRGVYCRGLVSPKLAPTTYNRFSLGIERYISNLPGVAGPLADSFRESYDQRSNITMIEGDGISFTLDRNKYGAGVLARINDFTRGISYVKNLRFGNCTYEKIPAVDWDSDPNPNGATIKTPDEFYFPSLAELQYKGSGTFRTSDVDIYLGYKDKYLDFGDGKKLPLTIEYYMNIKVTYDSVGNPVYTSVPLAAFSAAPNKFTTTVEVFDINNGVPKAFDHDISDCFAATQKQHFELILSTSELDEGYVKYLSDYRNEFMYSLVASISKAINVSPLRIIEPTVSLFAAPLILVEITVSERANVPDYTPKQPEIPLSQVASTLTDLVAKKTLVVDVMEGDLIFAVPVDGFVSMDERGAPRPSGMSSGAVAGLCIGMILLGIAIGVAVIAAVNYFRKKDALFGFAPFGGDQQASA